MPDESKYNKYEFVEFDKLKDREMILACIPKDIAAQFRLSLFSDFVTAPYTGSVEGKCGKCGVEVWIGPRQQETIAIDRPDAKCWCLDCVRESDGIVGTLDNHEHVER